MSIARTHVSREVLGLRLLPNGKTIVLDDILTAGHPKRMLSIGADPDCDISIDDTAVSGLHCMLERRGRTTHIYDCESKNGTWLNDARIKLGQLVPGTVIRLGRVQLAALGPETIHARPPVVIPATNLDEFLRGAVDTHGSLRGASEALGIAYSTLRGWLQRRRVSSDRTPPIERSPRC